MNILASYSMSFISLKLKMMMIILVFITDEYAEVNFIVFAISQSLGTSALGITGGIFTIIAAIGSGLMNVIIKIGEDDPCNPDTIADCVGDNAGDSVGSIADDFEIYDKEVFPGTASIKITKKSISGFILFISRFLI